MKLYTSEKICTRIRNQCKLKDHRLAGLFRETGCSLAGESNGACAVLLPEPQATRELPSGSEPASSVDARLAKALAEIHLWQERYRTIGESIPYGIWICDPDGQLTYCSRAILDLLGMTFQQVAGSGWYDTLHPDDVAATEHAWNECVRTGKDWAHLLRYKGKDGLYHPVLTRGKPIRNPDGTIREWVGVNFDVSELIAAYEDLKGGAAPPRTATG